ncbi:MAG: hypothetical protein V1754_10290 [Pseudomonadota bacterium]
MTPLSNFVTQGNPILPKQIAQSRASECLPKKLGSGARMDVYPLVDERMVLRVPRRTEQQLIDEFGSSGRKVLATGHEVSNVTEKELRNLEAIEGYIGAFVPDTTPLADLDMEGHFRYYSLQRRVQVTQDLRTCTSSLSTQVSRFSLERFIRDVRDMFKHLGIIPDLAGKENLVLDRYGLVKLIDINNFCRMVNNEKIDSAFPPDFEWDEYALGFKDVRKLLPLGFVDDLGLPIGDVSLGALHNLEIRGLGRDYKLLEKDPFYAPLRHKTRRILLTLLRSDMA